MEATLSSTEFREIEEDEQKRSATGENSFFSIQKQLKEFAEQVANAPPIARNESRSVSTSVADNRDVTAQNTSTTSTTTTTDEGDNFDDINDEELAHYFHTPEEVKIKTEVWTAMNQEYLDKMKDKEKEQAAGKSTPNKVFLLLWKKKVTYTLQRKRKREPKKDTPAETAREATAEMLKKKVSSKINYSALDALFSVEKFFDSGVSSFFAVAT